MGMSGETPFSNRRNQIDEVAKDMRECVELCVPDSSSNSKALLLMLVDNWKDERLIELVNLTVGKDNLSDITEEEIQLVGMGEIQKTFLGLIQ